MNDPYITVNVGGTHFSVNKSTFTKLDYFKELFQKHPRDVQRDNRGNIFLERDPKYFHYVMDYLRSGYVEFKSGDHNLIKQELEYFGIKLPEVTGRRYIIINVLNLQILSFSATDKSTLRIVEDVQYSLQMQGSHFDQMFRSLDPEIENEAQLLTRIEYKTGYKFMQSTIVENQQKEYIFVKE